VRKGKGRGRGARKEDRMNEDGELSTRRKGEANKEEEGRTINLHADQLTISTTIHPLKLVVVEALQRLGLLLLLLLLLRNASCRGRESDVILLIVRVVRVLSLQIPDTARNKTV
jgi:hypothetical protein